MRRAPPDVTVSRFRTALHLLASALRALPQSVVVWLPGDAGVALRQLVYGRTMRSLGRNVVFEPGVQLVNPQHMSFGDNCWIDRYAVLLAGPPEEDGRIVSRTPNAAFTHAEGELAVAENCHIAPHTVISAHGGVQIGRNTTVAAGARVYSFSHHHANLEDPEDRFPYRFSSKAPPQEQALISAPVVIGDDAAIGLNTVVLPGSTVGDRAWVGAGSLVRGEIPADAIATGTPAAPSRRRRA